MPNKKKGQGATQNTEPADPIYNVCILRYVYMIDTHTFTYRLNRFLYIYNYIPAHTEYMIYI